MTSITTHKTAEPERPPRTWVFPARPENPSPVVPAQDQEAARIPRVSLLSGLLHTKRGLTGASLGPSCRGILMFPPPVKEALAASIQQASGSMGLPSLPLGKAQAGISFPAHLTPTKGSFQTTGHTKENSEANIKKHPLPLPGCQGTLSDNYPCSDFCKVFYSLFSFHFVLFSLHKWKNALGKVAHIWIPQVHKEVSPNSHQPQALPRRDTLIPHAFLFISCSLPGENIGY